ncbi:LysR family transcriptional regulator [Novosphingobium sp. PhB165]|uniref:LysR family transcriptional regulator n=1 Tax=Novosphingobium sp. PhB165 TaxID=2485105 RepID=UPI001050EE82|nr:LysR family transcriptional regulator [Novosphingobium sp. PhB165]TCM20468.1 LysR family transcriptional regulator [Novosphingobium sp. PhB165]
MKISIRQLQVFDAVATLGSVTAAAAKLNVSQSAASTAISDLQIVLGRQLFAHAKGRPLQITDEGRRLHPMVRSVLGELEDIERDGQGELSGQLVIGATATIAETELPRLCVEFMRRHPKVQIRVESESTLTLFERLGRFEIETALIENFPNVPGIELTRWKTDELVLVVSADHPLARRGPLQIADLKDAHWCLREANSSETARLRYYMHEEIGQLPVAFESTSNWAVRHAVIAGGGIGCLSRALVQFDLDNGRLAQLDVAGFSYTRAFSLARPSSIRRSRLVAAFDHFLFEHE